MAENTEYFSMQGRVFIGDRNPDGSRGPAKWVYDASTLEWAMSTTEEDKNESWSGSRGLAATLKTGRTMQVNLTLAQLNSDLAALATDGYRVDIASGTVTGETIGDVVAGDVFALEYAAVSDVVLTDGTGAELAIDTDYTITLETGIMSFLAAKTGVTAAYTYAAHSIVTAFNGENKDRYVLFDGMNTVNGTVNRCRGEVHNVSFSPAETFGFIQDSFGEFALQGKAKMDPVRQPDPRWGPYARVMLVARNG